MYSVPVILIVSSKITVTKPLESLLDEFQDLVANNVPVVAP